VKNKRVFCLVALSLIVAFLTVNQGFAQKRTGTITGTVKDEQGELLPGVTVTLKGEALMGTRSMITGAQGEFRFLAIPVGSGYEITFSLAGFQTVIAKNQPVTIGATVTLDIVLKPAKLEEEVTVLGASPLVDVERSSFSSTYDSKTLESLPTRRFTFFDMVQAAPGVTAADPQGSRQSAFGSEVKSNAYYINGIDISAPSTGAAWPWPMPDTIGELEVIGVGAPAEYGNFEGAVINVVSKSGSNTLHGAAKLFLQTSSLTASNTPGEQWPFHRDHWHDAIFQLGGPFVKDKLWFFGSVQHNVDKSSGVGADPQFPTEYSMKPTADVKIDYQLDKKNKISLFAHYENYRYPYDPPTAYKPAQTCSYEVAPAVTPTIEWLHMVSDKTYFEIKYGGFYTNLEYKPFSGDMNTGGHEDWGNGYFSVNAMGYYKWKTNRTQLNANVSHFADNFLHGSHEFKAGVQYNHGYSDFIYGYIGGVKYYDWMNYPLYAYFRNPSHYGGMVDQVGVFVDDTWEVSSRLTANLGLRFDYNHGSIPDFEELDSLYKPTGTTIPGIPDAVKWTQISPRIGINYQLTPDRKTVLRASYGRYNKGLVIGDIEAATPAQAPLYAYAYNWDTHAYSDFMYVWNPLEGLALDKNLKPPHTEQFALALEREIVRDFSLSATFIYKTNKDRIDRINRAQYEQIPVTDLYSGQTIMVYNQVLPIQNDYLITNPGDKITYRSLMLVANKRFSNNFQLYGSFTWSRTWWVPKGFKDKNDLINGEGVFKIGSGVSREWMFKLGGAYNAPFGIILGTNIIYQQGASWERTIYVDGLNQGGKFIKAEQRGSRRMPSELYFDVKAEKVFMIANRYSVEVSLDVINLFNENTPLSYVSYTKENPNFMVPTTLILPRRAMLGLKFVF
jgi:hypothetical protein